VITPKKVFELATAEPFRPFRFHMASGKSFDVRHPENIKVGKSSVTVYLPVDGDENVEQWREVSLMLFEYVEPIEAAQAQGG